MQTERAWEGAEQRVLVIEDDELVREGLAPVLTRAGYTVAFANNGHEALERLHAEVEPDLIVLDLKMPVMNGWEFRKIQQEDPRLGRIPVVAMSADGSPQAAAVSAQAYLRKPFTTDKLLVTIERILIENHRKRLAQATEDDRLTSLESLGAGVGHEINNPLAVLLLNLRQSMLDLRSPIRVLETPLAVPLTPPETHALWAGLVEIEEMLKDCEKCSRRIAEVVTKLQRLAHHTPKGQSIDLNALLDRSLAPVWDSLRERARLVKCYGVLPPVWGDSQALEQLFVNVLRNAVEALPQSAAATNEVRIVTRVAAGAQGPELVVEIQDSGVGMPPEVAAQAFQPFFTTKPIGSGAANGLGLSLSRQTAADHGGRITVESNTGKGTVIRVFLPAAAVHDAIPVPMAAENSRPPQP